MMCTCFNLT
ncbi:hypothetical protein CGLO_13298 [Colletotrichum gloeosporioides Cg-14]|uniref:Uncharacterized protein n=1 Tax=Colletotrichum gloeosporioides (strain Cg-14) TaxID=1237896 RepID=T0K6D8_COLGC|nr:hypothetical protein CGLO_13298 [Colletotrichum gloeosporioides Cg-14]